MSEQPFHRTWKKRNPDKSAVHARAARLKTYGLTIDEYEQMREARDCLCDICGKHDSEQDRKLAVDHSHATGKIRGLLCNDCNRNLIRHREDPAIFYLAAAYLEKAND